MKQRGYNIVIIDSGIKLDEYLNIKKMISGKRIICQSSGEILIDDKYEDQIGHGTAVLDCLIKENALISHLYIINIYNDSGVLSSVDALNAALIYIDNHIECDMVLISSGIICTDKLDLMQRYIENLTQKGVIIISAFDNDGLISYPAAFESVIGVATNWSTNEKPRIVENSKVDIVMQEKRYRLKWVNPAKIIVGGSSFAVPVVAAKITHVLARQEGAVNLNKEFLLKELAEELDLPYIVNHVQKMDTTFTISGGQSFSKNIRKAVLFPWNKEIHALARYRDILQFEIAGFFDAKYSSYLGRDIGTLLGEKESYQIIRNIDTLDWEGDFDTIICGHCEEISLVTNHNWLDEIAKKCEKYHKRLYAFDREATEYAGTCDLFVPTVRNADIPYYVGGRLCERVVPVIGVFGTSSKQGKYSVQLELRKRFCQNGYNLGQIVTEPSGYLFGAEAVFPFGYNSNVDVGITETTLIINHWINNIINDDIDAVLIGGQSGSIPFSYNNLTQINFVGYGLLCGANPDIFVLCINPHDPIDYIKNTINFLHSFNGSSVCALVLFPVVSEASTNLGYGIKRRTLDQEELIKISEKIESMVNIPVCILGSDKDMDKLFETIIETLS